MKSRVVILLAISSLVFAEYSVFPPGPQPAVYMDFEYHGGTADSANPAFHSKAPGNWNGTSNIGSSNVGYCGILNDGGVDGHDCLDKTSVSQWGASGAFIGIGSDADGYDNIVEDSLDNLWSFTVCGWLKTTAACAIGGNGRIFYRKGQFEIYAPDGVNTGRLALRVPAMSGTNASDITVMSQNVYNQPGQWVFFAITYDGTKQSDNVNFYTAGINTPIAQCGTSAANAGRLTGGEHLSIRITGGGEAFGQYAAAGYFDKFAIYACSQDNDDACCLSESRLENLRRWQLRLPLHYNDARPGDTNLDGDVDQDDINTITANINTGGVKYLPDGDVNGDLVVDEADLTAANANFGAAENPVSVMIIDSMTKINSVSEFGADGNPSAQLSAAKGENEHFQIAVKSNQYRIENINISASLFTDDLNVLPSESIKLRRADKVRVGTGYDQLLFDPLVEKTSGTAAADELLLFWFSVDVPLTQKAGIYQGFVIVDMPSGQDLQIPVSVKVWDITVARKQNFQTSYNLFRQCLRNYYGGSWDDPTSEQYRQWLKFCVDYRISPVDMSLNEDSSHRFIKITRKLDRTWEFDFTLFNAYVDYCYSHGMRNFNVGDLYWHFWKPFYGYDEVTSSYRTFNLLTSQYEEVFAQYISEAKQQYRMDGPRPYENMAFFYAFDELNITQPEVLQECIDRHDRVEENWPALHTLSTSEPRRYPSYEGHIDIWCGKIPNYYKYTLPEVDRLRAAGNQFWTYVTGYAPPYCNLEINEPGIEHRLIFWQNYVEGLDGFLHWGLNVWPHYRRPNPWVGDIAVEADYDKWPNRAWDDGGWVIQKYTDGGGYLIYPSPDGPVASIRLEMMRDGLEDWELINNLRGLIERAAQSGAGQQIIDEANAAINLDDTVTAFNVYSSDPSVLQNRRVLIAEAAVMLASEMGSQKNSDINNDQSTDSGDLLSMGAKWLESGIDIDADLNYDETVDIADISVLARAYQKMSQIVRYDPSQAAVYLPFENTNGVYGLNSIGNPAWLNAAINEAPNYIGNSQSTYPAITGDGIKGDALYASDQSKTGLKTMTISWIGATLNAFSQAQSYTVCGWLNTRVAAKNGSDTYIVRCVGGGVTVKWRSDGRLQVLDSADGVWRYANYNEGCSNGNWVFFAVVRDDGGIRFYFGGDTLAVQSGNAISGLSLAKTADCTRFILGGYTYNGTDNYLNCDIDEIRVFSSKTDNSGALSLENLEDIRKFDIGL